MTEQNAPQNKIKEQFNIFSDVMTLIENLRLERGRSIYFSSAAPKELVDEIRTHNPHLISPWDTNAGKKVLGLRFEQEENAIEWSKLAMLRRRLIQTFVSYSSGNFTVVFPETNAEPDEGVLSSIVLKGLRINNAIETVNNQPKEQLINDYCAKIATKPQEKGKILPFIP